jgi:hypothetical protein
MVRQKLEAIDEQASARHATYIVPANYFLTRYKLPDYTQVLSGGLPAGDVNYCKVNNGGTCCLYIHKIQSKR